MKFQCFAKVSGSKYLGIVEAETEDEAIEKANSLPEAHVSVCHQCSRQIEDPEIEQIIVQPA